MPHQDTPLARNYQLRNVIDPEAPLSTTAGHYPQLSPLRQQLRQQPSPPRHPARRHVQTRLDLPRMPSHFHRCQQQMLNQHAHTLRHFALRQVQQLQRLQHIVGQRRQRMETLIRRQPLTRWMMQLEVARPLFQIPLEPMPLKRPLHFACPIVAGHKLPPAPAQRIPTGHHRWPAIIRPTRSDRESSPHPTTSSTTHPHRAVPRRQWRHRRW